MRSQQAYQPRRQEWFLYEQYRQRDPQVKYRQVRRQSRTHDEQRFVAQAHRLRHDHLRRGPQGDRQGHRQGWSLRCVLHAKLFNLRRSATSSKRRRFQFINAHEIRRPTLTIQCLFQRARRRPNKEGRSSSLLRYLRDNASVRPLATGLRAPCTMFWELSHVFGWNGLCLNVGGGRTCFILLSIYVAFIISVLGGCNGCGRRDGRGAKAKTLCPFRLPTVRGRPLFHPQPFQ